MEKEHFPSVAFVTGRWSCDSVCWCVCMFAWKQSQQTTKRRRRQSELWPEKLSLLLLVWVCFCVWVVQARCWLVSVRPNTVCQASATDRALSKQEIDCLLSFPLSLICEYYPLLFSIFTFLSLYLLFVNPVLDLVCLFPTSNLPLYASTIQLSLFCK